MRLLAIRGRNEAGPRNIVGLFGEARSFRQRLVRGVQNATLFTLVTLGTLTLLHGYYAAAGAAFGGLLAFVLAAALMDGGGSELEIKPGQRLRQAKRDGMLRIKNGRIVRGKRFSPRRRRPGR